VPNKLRLTLVKSLIGLSPKQEATAKALGLRHIRQSVEHDDTPTIRGMIRLVSFCLTVEEAGAAVATALTVGGAGTEQKPAKRVGTKEARSAK
jgi:large subunit ribosomal protein L30